MGTFKGRTANDITFLVTAALVTKQNVMIIGEPGGGKTSVARSYADQLFGRDYCMVKIEPTSAVEKVKGAVDVQTFFTSGEWRMNVTKTPYDPNNQLVILDEFGRGNSAMFDVLMEVCDQPTENDGPPVVGTSNFLPTGERQQALLDRFGIYYWVQPEPISISDLIDAHLNGSNPHTDMSGIDYDRIREAHSIKLSPIAKQAVHRLLADLSDEAQRSSKKLNKRRVTQWIYMVSRMAAYICGHGDFERVPEEAAKLLRWAYPTMSVEEQIEWADIADSISDKVGAALEAASAEFYKVMTAYRSLSLSERSGKSTELGSQMHRILTTLRELGMQTGDPRPKQRAEKITLDYANWLNGD